jgi:hypothetical protein
LIDDVKDCGKSSTIELTVVPESGVLDNFKPRLLAMQLFEGESVAACFFAFVENG